jgi:hypothetical protein
LEEWDMDTEAIEVGALTVGSMADGSRYKSEGQDNHRAALTWGMQCFIRKARTLRDLQGGILNMQRLFTLKNNQVV